MNCGFGHSESSDAVMDVKPWREGDLEMDLEDLPLIWDDCFNENDSEQVNLQVSIIDQDWSRDSDAYILLADLIERLRLLTKTDEMSNSDQLQSLQCLPVTPKMETPVAPSRKSKSVTFADPCCQSKSDCDYYRNEMDCPMYKPLYNIKRVESPALPLENMFDKTGVLKVKSSLKLPATVPLDLPPVLVNNDDSSTRFSPERKRSFNGFEQNGTSRMSPETLPPVLSPQQPFTSLRVSPTKVFLMPRKRRRSTETNSNLEKYFNNQSKHVSLEKYYYSEFPGKPVTTQTLNKFMKCPVCSKLFATNVEIYSHIYKHVVALGIRVSAITTCHYCLDSFQPSELTPHINKSHKLIRDRWIGCRICEVGFLKREELIAHMWDNHCKQDMPYVCQLCDYRSSFKFQVIDHFHQVHEGSANVLCVLCLTVLPVETEIHMDKIATHIKKHQLSKSKRCSQCSLVFIDDVDLNNHLKRDAHTSKQVPKDLRKVIKFQESATKLFKMPRPPPEFLSDERRKNRVSARPDTVVPRRDFVKRKLNFLSKQKPVFSPTPPLVLNVTNEKCWECGSLLKRSRHFPGVMMCQKCPFKTCCQTSMDRHDSGFHRTVEVSRMTRASDSCIHVKKSPLFDEPYFCSCGFKSINPNRLARHLALCDKVTACLLKE